MVINNPCSQRSSEPFAAVRLNVRQHQVNAHAKLRNEELYVAEAAGMPIHQHERISNTVRMNRRRSRGPTLIEAYLGDRGSIGLRVRCWLFSISLVLRRANSILV